MRRLVAATLAAAALAGCAADGGGSALEPPATTRSGPAAVPHRVRDTDWPTYHHDNARTGVAPGFAAPGPLSQAWSARLDGAVYGQPLVLGETVVAATENDTVYALAAADGHVLWSRHLGSPQPLAGLPCGDIDPLGITGTPAYDPATGLVFVVAELTGGTHLLAGLDLATGDVALSRPVEPPRGTPSAHQQRAALTVLDGSVYLAYGGLYGDCGDYVGSVVAAPTTGLGPLRTYAVPTTREGGIWAPGGASVAAGKLYFAVGNGESTSAYDHSDSILALSPELALLDAFSPAEWADDNAHDRDLGSMGPVVVGGHVYADGKRGIGYVLDATRLGGIGGQLSAQPVCAAYGGGSVDGGRMYLPCRDGTRAVDLDPAGRLTVRWRAPVPADGSPTVGGGAVWTVDTRAGVLYALDTATGAVRGRLPVGAVPHFASPSLSGGRAYLGTMSGVVAVAGA
ncbi:PQQ-binding-like beta-propeller repeat protein [Amycolatopsis rhizosphaerae]|uniref:PQQ-binding-like beta-propeller repeat protein n=1 Tax=Amycolatopsis rhizosphaerae TaxID=2053003 RepID=A0A558BFB5_9PSEU|nr:PQQ-binding-like beta-propeller repeat protein [Amycolatopsis rhizosphaerae]TVT35200.1 PQQ-binding-like beta-propeller repeat protein [Amycolatopsis rhizosphaerae]